MVAWNEGQRKALKKYWALREQRWTWSSSGLGVEIKDILNDFFGEVKYVSIGRCLKNQIPFCCWETIQNSTNNNTLRQDFAPIRGVVAVVLGQAKFYTYTVDDWLKNGSESTEVSKLVSFGGMWIHVETI